jgi:predicted outer membrane repeat protein
VTIQGGNAQGQSRGGGIYFKGNGTLELHHATISQNTAGFGGGIYAEATGDSTKLVIGEDVAIVGNTARYDGGGVVNDGATMTMTAPDSYIASNHAQGLYVDDFSQYGYGGGLLILTGDHKAHTFLGSSGPGSVGTIYLNTASYGGGVAMRATNYPADLNLFSIDPTRPMRIKGNTASSIGGGILLADAPGELLNIWYAYLEDNIAPEGAAILVTASQSGIFFNDPSHRPAGSIDCPIGKPCGGINGNLAEDNDSHLAGAIVQAGAGTTARFRRMEFRGNSGGLVFQGSYAVGLEMRHVAMTDNTTALSLISTIADHTLDGFADLEDTTIADNMITNYTVLKLSNASGNEKIHRSIIWQPGYFTLQNYGAAPDLLDVMVGERDSIDPDGTASVIEQDPRFVDPAHGDYSLRAGSPAIDYAAPIVNDTQDLYSRPRDVDLPVIENFHGLRDLGAIERPTLQPIVLNSDFDTGLQFWNLTNFDVTTWDSTRSISGAPGSGSAHISLTNAGSGVKGVYQCMHLPAPGVYQLNGYGHGTGTMFTAGDIAELVWEFRKSGGENCIAGAPNASNTLTLSSSNSWTRLANPASIEVTAQDWTLTSSITLTLVAVENGAGGSPTNAWFDGITLHIDGDDKIFGNGFDP